MRLLAVGRARQGPEAAILDRYAARLKPRLTLVEFNDGFGNPAEIKRREAADLLAAVTVRDYVIALDQAGDALGSPELAAAVRRWTETGRRLNFLVGGAEGLDAAVLARADATLSLGRLTWPHMLVRPMLAEQLYRAQTILAGHPYHRAGRP